MKAIKNLIYGLMAVNLQLFAELNTNTTGSDSLSVENKTHYDMTLIDEAGPELVHAQFGQKRPIPKGKGKKIEFRKFASLPKATKPLTEGVTPDGSKLNVTSIESEVGQYGDYVVTSDMLELSAIDPILVETTKVLGKQAGMTLDTIIRNKLQGGDMVFYCPKIGADGTKTEVTSRADLDTTCRLTVDMVRRVAATLKANNAPKIDGSYVAIIHPHVAFDLQNDEHWEEAHKYTTPENIYEGELGKIAGIRFVESSEAKIYYGAEDGCADNTAVYGCLFFGANAYGVTEIEGGGLQTIFKQKGSAGTGDPLEQRASIGWKATSTAEILIQNYLWRVECCSDMSNSVDKAN